MDEYRYQSGFGNEFCSQAIDGTLPRGQNSPQQVPKGLYAEQLSGTAFTVPRSCNKRSWLYRVRPSVMHSEFAAISHESWLTPPFPATTITPNRMRWCAHPVLDEPLDFIDSICTYAGGGDARTNIGIAIHMYAATKSMDKRFFYNADGELLIVPQLGELQIATEFGNILLAPGEIGVIGRGIKFQVNLAEDCARGYLCENFGLNLQLPELGPIGANGLANPRDFLAPTAAFVADTGDYILTTKFQGQLFNASLGHNPLDVVAWHGNYVPYKYDLKLFCTMNTVSFDHPDPSIFTVLTAPSSIPGIANIDFVIFPDRWMVAEHSFRPPYFHRNIMNEFMGLVYGSYDAKEQGFEPGGASLHNCMAAHGPDKDAFEQGTTAKLKPRYYKNTLAFMFESQYVLQASEFALQTPTLQHSYTDCWQNLPVNFSGDS